MNKFEFLAGYRLVDNGNVKKFSESPVRSLNKVSLWSGALDQADHGLYNDTSYLESIKRALLIESHVEAHAWIRADGEIVGFREEVSEVILDGRWLFCDEDTVGNAKIGVSKEKTRRETDVQTIRRGMDWLAW